MSLQSQSTPTASTMAAMPAVQTAPTTCPRCGTELPRANIACNQRTCRPSALRRVSFVPYVPLESAVNQNIEHIHGDLLRIS